MQLKTIFQHSLVYIFESSLKEAVIQDKSGPLAVILLQCTESNKSLAFQNFFYFWLNWKQTVSAAHLTDL